MSDKPTTIYGETFSHEPPRPSPVVYDVLARHMANTESALHDTLNDVYKTLNDTEYDVSRALDALVSKGTIRREDTLILVVLLAVSRTLGPDLDFLRRALITNNGNPAEIDSQILHSGLQPAITSYVRGIISKLKM